MNFTEVVQAVAQETKREDKIVSIRREVNSAINLACSLSNFVYDLEETTVAVDATLYSQSIDLTDLTRFRKVCWIRQQGEDCFLQSIDITADLKRRSSAWVNKYYVTGQSIIYKTDKLNGTIELSYFKYPPVLTDNEPTFWLLDMSPYLIIDKACSKIFRDIGDDKSAQLKEADFRQALLAAQADFTYGINKGR